MPGVADQIRKTQLKQDQKARRNEMQELLCMVQEGRLHEADERQLEVLKTALELNNILQPKETPQSLFSPEELVDAVKQVISEGISNISLIGGMPAINDPARPDMKHVSLADLVQGEEKIEISHQEKIGKAVEGGDSSDKLAKLRELKKGK